MESDGLRGTAAGTAAGAEALFGRPEKFCLLEKINDCCSHCCSPQDQFDDPVCAIYGKLFPAFFFP